MDTLFFVCTRIVVESSRHFFSASAPDEEVTTACFVVMRRDKGVGHRDKGVGRRDKGVRRRDKGVRRRDKGGSTAFLIAMTRDKGGRLFCEGDKETFKGECFAILNGAHSTGCYLPMIASKRDDDSLGMAE